LETQDIKTQPQFNHYKGKISASQILEEKGKKNSRLYKWRFNIYSHFPFNLYSLSSFNHCLLSFYNPKTMKAVLEGDKLIKEVLNGGYNVHPVPPPNSEIKERIRKRYERERIKIEKLFTLGYTTSGDP
jgi:hypothetical protein